MASSELGGRMMDLTHFLSSYLDVDVNLIFVYIPLLSALSLIITASLTAFCKLRSRLPLKVNCWFCNNYSKIPRESLKWWLCSNCEQYNGFSSDGDYNYDISEQYALNGNVTTKSKNYCQRSKSYTNHNRLCNKCNYKEELKLMKLRELEDSMVVYSDKKLAKFKEKFERDYPLCLSCQNIVQKVIYKQKQWLTQYKMLLFKKKQFSTIFKNHIVLEKFLRMVLVILASVSLYFTESWYFPLCGFGVQFAACLASTVNSRQLDIFPVLGWICLIFAHVIPKTTVIKLFNIDIDYLYTDVANEKYQHFIVILCVLLGLINFRLYFFKKMTNNVAFKKLESCNKSCSELYPDTWNNFSNLNESNTISDIPCNDSLSINDKSSEKVKKPWLVQNSQQITPSSHNINNELELDTSPATSIKNHAPSLNDSLTSLHSLNLGHHRKISPNNSPKIFEKKIYGSNFSANANRNNHQNRRPILAPPKLRGAITQTSWVAGGFWQSGPYNSQTSLSRSSSQSSGIASLSSANCTFTREPIVREYDQCSDISDQLYTWQNRSECSKLNSYNPVKCYSPPPISEYSSCMSCFSQNKCGGHSTTIVSSPTWLTALLCGSLIFNMVVLCILLITSLRF
ncbi:hypothetical protein TKK_0008873 [Trichogramma kaykai]|uniref:Ima1 N-terminal domain-containing protein n=1 Tax=Trichogramma kaykai TaxID=54128 RepID=A0ABD2X3I3_9HYME